MSKNQKPPIDPVILAVIGILFIAVAIGLAAFQSNPNSINAAKDSGTMSQLIVAFVTGLTTGGLSCLAVQGGNWDGGVLTQPTGAAPQTTVVSTQWQPESMFMLGTGRTATTTQTALESHAMMNFGVANMTTDGRAMSLGTRQLNPSFILVHDALDTTTELARTYDVTATPPVAPVARAQWTATTASSFTLTWNSTDATARKWFYIIAAPESAEVFPPPKGRKRRIQFGDVGAFDIGFNAIQEIAK